MYLYPFLGWITIWAPRARVSVGMQMVVSAYQSIM
jgi:hypothetical protein